MLNSVALFGELHQLIEEEQWHEVDALLRESWQDLRDTSLRPFLARMDEPLEWFTLMERVDARVLGWLTEETQRERVREALESVEGRLDRLVQHGVGLLLDMNQGDATRSPLLDKLARHEETLQRWLTFLLFEIFPATSRVPGKPR